MMHNIIIAILSIISIVLLTTTIIFAVKSREITSLTKLKNIYRDELVYSGSPCSGKSSPNTDALFCLDGRLAPTCYSTQSTSGNMIRRGVHLECLYNGNPFNEPTV